MNKKILITGVSGLLGNNLAAYFSKADHVAGVYHSHPVAIPGVETHCIDLCNYPETRDLLNKIRPDVVIHCASRTDVDQMEDEREEGWQANVLSTRVLLDAVRDFRTKFVHISTDSVYAGKHGPYKESMETTPCNWYGKTKLESEQLVSIRKNALILRTNLYGWNIQDKQSLAEWFLARLWACETTMGFSDAQFSSIYTFSLADIIARCIERNIHGVFNCACRDSWTKFQFGQNLADIFGLNPDLIIPASLKNADMKAKRGHDLRMDVRRLEKELQTPLPTMAESLNSFFRDWKRQVPVEIKQNNTDKPQPLFYPLYGEINYGRQAVDQDDIDAVINVLKSPYLTQGHEVCRFEEETADYVGARYGIAVNSGTAALHLACLACGLSPGDEGITSPNTFLASANAIVYCGAAPRFSDIDPHTYNMSPQQLEKRITKRTKVVIPVHFAGQSCDMREIRKVVSEKERLFGHKIYIIEDACHALGSLYQKRKVGSCDYSDAAAFSFHPVKHITTGEGGMVLTNHHGLANAVRNLRSHGITKSPGAFVQKELAFQRHHAEKPPHTTANPWYYEQLQLGFNYRITDFQCALGRSQLKKLDKFRKRRREIVNLYNEAFDNIKFVEIPFESSECDSNFHLYVLLFDFGIIGINRARFMLELKKKGIQTQVHYIPVHLQPYFRRNFETKKVDCPTTEQYYQKCLSIPLYPAMGHLDVKKVITETKHIFEGSI